VHIGGKENGDTHVVLCCCLNKDSFLSSYDCKSIEYGYLLIDDENEQTKQNEEEEEGEEEENVNVPCLSLLVMLAENNSQTFSVSNQSIVFTSRISNTFASHVICFLKTQSIFHVSFASLLSRLLPVIFLFFVSKNFTEVSSSNRTTTRRRQIRRNSNTSHEQACLFNSNKYSQLYCLSLSTCYYL
jgi:hypothetical protein